MRHKPHFAPKSVRVADARGEVLRIQIPVPTTTSPESETALAIRDARIDLWRDPDWQRLWLALQSRPWHSLAIVPGSEGAPKDFALRIAVILSRTGMVHLGRPVQVCDATNVPLAYLTQLIEEMAHCKRAGEPILVALAPAAGSPLTVSIAQATDAALLCVLLERMTNAQTKKTVTQIGANRFVGSAIFRSEGELSPVAPPSSRRRR
jgi:hypothetical protein